MMKKFHAFHLAFGLVLWIGLMCIACDGDSGNSSPDGDSPTDVEYPEAPDGDMDREAVEEFQPHEPSPCNQSNHCQTRAFSDGAFCFGHDFMEEPERSDTLITCGLDEDGCIAVLNEEVCPFGCDTDLHECRQPLRKLSGTVTRTNPVVNLVEGQAEADSFSGELYLMLYPQERPAGGPPSVQPELARAIMDIDLTDSSAEVDFTWDLMVGLTTDLPAGTYYLDAFLYVGGYEKEDPPESGDLMLYATIPVQVPEEGEITQDITFDRVFHDSVLSD